MKETKEAIPPPKVRRGFFLWFAGAVITYLYIAPITENIATSGGYLRFGRDTRVEMFVPDEVSPQLLWIDGRLVRPRHQVICLWVDKGSHTIAGLVDGKLHRQNLEIVHEGESYPVLGEPKPLLSP